MTLANIRINLSFYEILYEEIFYTCIWYWDYNLSFKNRIIYRNINNIETTNSNIYYFKIQE